MKKLLSEKIVRIIKNKKRLEELLNVKDTKAKNILKEMREKGLIERVGKGSLTHYILKKK